MYGGRGLWVRVQQGRYQTHRQVGHAGGHRRCGQSEGWFSSVLRAEAVCCFAEGGQRPPVPLIPD